MYAGSLLLVLIFLAERIRDEVHRYTLAYHRKLRGRQFHRSALESIEGVGPARASRSRRVCAALSAAGAPDSSL